MAGRPKEERLLKTMRTLAQEELGAEGATPLDFACAMIAGGRTTRQVADRVSEAMGETFSLDWLRWVLNRQPEGKERLRAAREMAAYALVHNDTLHGAQASVDATAGPRPAA
jgi:hypothetical protein